MYRLRKTEIIHSGIFETKINVVLDLQCFQNKEKQWMSERTPVNETVHRAMQIYMFVQINFEQSAYVHYHTTKYIL